MELREIMELQNEFDRAHFPEWSSDITADDLNVMQFLLVSLMGELGELANGVKKVARGDIAFDAAKTIISEEVTDTFIYLIKICNQMGINLEAEFQKKLHINKRRFAHEGDST